MLQDTNKICKQLHKTYNAHVINKKSKIGKMFLNTAKNYNKTDKTLVNLINNLSTPATNHTIVDYISGPGYIQKYQSKKYNKTIYLFGENDHNTSTSCKTNNINLKNKTSSEVYDYLLDLFKHSPVFIDFYIELGIMLDDLESYASQHQTLQKMFFKMKGCFGPLDKRDCQYNVRMHGVDSRSVISKKYTNSPLAELSMTLMMQNVISKHTKGEKNWITLEDFKKKFKNMIDVFSKVRNVEDLVKIVKNEVKNNKLIAKEMKKSSLPHKKYLDFFITKKIPETINQYINNGPIFTGTWFSALKNQDNWPAGLDITSLVITICISTMMDVYAASRMFKTFNVKKEEQYPVEASNIVYYAGTGHTNPMGEFLTELGFIKIEDSGEKYASCVDMREIQQPMFT